MSAVSKNDFVVTAIWDDEPEVWVADSDEVPGLIAEAESKTRYTLAAPDKFMRFLASANYRTLTVYSDFTDFCSDPRYKSD